MEANGQWCVSCESFYENTFLDVGFIIIYLAINHNIIDVCLYQCMKTKRIHDIWDM